MTISELKIEFKRALSALYSESESAELFYIFAHHIIGLDKFQLRKFSHQTVLQQDEEALKHIISELKTGKPYQYILGTAEFYGRSFFVNEHTLIPRPETEELLEFAIEKIQNRWDNEEKHLSSDVNHPKLNFRILDIGTGSGIIPIVLKKHFPNADITAIDISEQALEIARKNAEYHQTPIRFIQQDYLHSTLEENYDIIISNPPYIGQNETDEIAPSVKGFEPMSALFSPTTDPLIFYRKIAQDGEKHLREKGMIFLEINQKLGKETLELFQNFPESQLLKDLSSNDRIIYAGKEVL